VANRSPPPSTPPDFSCAAAGCGREHALVVDDGWMNGCTRAAYWRLPPYAERASGRGEGSGGAWEEQERGWERAGWRLGQPGSDGQREG
jgi:hypothetical protein